MPPRGCIATAVSGRSSVRRLLLLLVNLVATFLTLLTGLRENPVVLYLTGKYEYVRSRFLDGDINYDNLRRDLIRREAMIDLIDVGTNYHFVQGPLRNRASVGADRSLCMRVNTMNVSLMIGRYDDFWGTGTRRVTRFAHSISAPNCDVLNLLSEWINDCVRLNGDAASCHRHILDNFDTLRGDFSAQALTPVENGMLGAPYLRCSGRPEEDFTFKVDWMLQHAYWAGGNYHVELQTSDCQAIAVARTSDWKHTLFQVEPVDDASTFVVAVPGGGIISHIVSYFYGAVALLLIVNGVTIAIIQSSAVLYVPSKMRFAKEFRFARWILPFMSVATAIGQDENTIVRLKCRSLMASSFWINHWLYILVSILDAVINIRKAYVIFGYGTWYLLKKITFTNFIFACGALTRISWFMCFVHTLQRHGLKLVLRSLRKFRMLRPEWRRKLEWYVDAVALFMSYKLYNVILCSLLYTLLLARGSVTFMVKMNPFKVPAYGGLPTNVRFAGSELVCDYLVITAILTVVGWLIGSVMLLTKYSRVANNSVVHLLQRRYFFVGWDPFVAFDALGIDPFQPSLVDEGSPATSCSLGSLLQQMYQSGPSGLVSLAGDYIFERGGLAREPVTFRYQSKRAVRVRLMTSSRALTEHFRVAKVSDVGITSDTAKSRTRETTSAASLPTSRDLFDRCLTIHGTTAYTQILLVDTENPGKCKRNREGIREYVVRDAMSFLTVHDIEQILEGEMHLRIR